MRPIPTFLAATGVAVLIAWGTTLAVASHAGRALADAPPSAPRHHDAIAMPPSDHVIGGAAPATPELHAAIDVAPAAPAGQPQPTATPAAAEGDPASRPMLDPHGVDPVPTR